MRLVGLAVVAHHAFEIARVGIERADVLQHDRLTAPVAERPVAIVRFEEARQRIAIGTVERLQRRLRPKQVGIELLAGEALAGLVRGAVDQLVRFLDAVEADQRLAFQPLRRQPSAMSLFRILRCRALHFARKVQSLGGIAHHRGLCLGKLLLECGHDFALGGQSSRRYSECKRTCGDRCLPDPVHRVHPCYPNLNPVRPGLERSRPMDPPVVPITGAGRAIDRQYNP